MTIVEMPMSAFSFTVMFIGRSSSLPDGNGFFYSVLKSARGNRNSLPAYYA